MFSHGSRRQLSQREIAPNPETNPNPNWGGGQFSLGAIVWVPSLMIVAYISSPL